MKNHSKVNVLILGSGGREHAIAWKIAQSEKLDKLYIAPGNPGTSELAINIHLNITDYNAIKNVIIQNNIQLLIIGPEIPLVNGLNDQLTNDEDVNNLIIIGPQKKGAKLEGSKSFAKKFMTKYNIPTANYKSFTPKEAKQAIDYVSELTPPYVIKADGLAAGKGVFICKNEQEAQNTINSVFFESKVGDAGKKIVIEEFLTGIELSVFILTDGKSYKILPAAKDYKRIGEGDTGLNTGGMGAVSPVPFANKEFIEKVKKHIINPTLSGLKKERIEYVGFIFLGLINVNEDPYVIEYNVRLGDPESQVVIPRIDSDLLELLLSIESSEKFKNHSIDISQLNASTIIMSAGGYPETYNIGDKIHGIKKVENSIVFHAGTLKKEDDSIITNGGRVLAITSLNESLKKSIELSYNNIKKIDFPGCYYRKDIGEDLF